MNKDVEQHLDELIEYYSKCELDDVEYLKKLFVRNLNDVKRRYVKYDKPRKKLSEEKEKLKNWLKEESEKLHQMCGDNWTTVGQAVYQEVLTKMEEIENDTK